MATDQEFNKKEYKHLSTFEKAITWIVPIGSIITGIIVMLFFFVIGPDEPCDIDKASMYCRVHPLTLLDIIGLILFIWGVLWLGSLLPRFFIAMGWLSDDSRYFTALNIIAFFAAIGGFSLIYAV